MTDLEEYRLTARSWIESHLTVSVESTGAGPWTDKDDTIQYLEAQRATQKIIYEGGYAGITWPLEFGGRGLSHEHEAIFWEEAEGFQTPDFGKIRLATFGVVAPTLFASASPEFLRRHIPRILSADELWCQFFSEPSAGSDLAAVATTATRDGDEWVINGSKIWTSYAHVTDMALCLARTDPLLPKHRGLSWFAIPTNAPGVQIKMMKQIDGTIGFCEEFLDNVRVPDSERVGEINDGWSIARKMLLFERDSDGKKWQSSLDPGPLPPDLLALARSVGRDSDYDVIQQLALAHTNDYVVRHLFSRVGDLFDDGVDPLGMAAFGKLAQGVYDPVRARAAIDIGGVSAVAWPPDDEISHDAAMSYLNGRIFGIAGGTNEMQRNTIAERILGLPREPSAPGEL